MLHQRLLGMVASLMPKVPCYYYSDHTIYLEYILSLRISQGTLTTNAHRLLGQCISRDILIRNAMSCMNR